MTRSKRTEPGRRRHAAARRGFPSYVRVGVKLTGALLSFTLFAVSGWAWYNFADFQRHTKVVDVAGLGEPTTSAGSSRAPRVDGRAQNILIVGVDSRAGLTEAQKRYYKVGNDSTTSTDTLMLVHVPADGSRATLISIPRDSWVHIPGHPDGKINAAYVDGYYYSGAKGAQAQQAAGASTLVATVKQLTGVTIDHYVQVGFQGFVKIVSAIGKIPINLCETVDDTAAFNRSHGVIAGSGFKMTAGHHELTPVQALEFVRQRHNIPGTISDDLGRELRQRYFLSAVFKKVLSAHVLLNPFSLRKLVKAVDGAFTFDNENFDITKFAEQMVNLSAGNITGRSIPTDGNITVDEQSALKVDPAKVRRAVHQAFYGGDRPTKPAPTTSGTPSGTPGDLTSPARQRCVY